MKGQRPQAKIFTMQQIADYLRDPGLCPFCGFDQISGGFIEITNGKAMQHVTCLRCEGEWTDIYHLAHIVAVRPPVVECSSQEPDRLAKRERHISTKLTLDTK
jgi:formate dehydrogenase maturation protein FdhE